jgi:predicted ArsR family transcriptional regulator
MAQLGDRQWDLVKLLARVREGMTIDALAEALGITRPAIRQHLSVLERDGYVSRGEYRPTGGRPVQVYELTDAGRELFPRQYSWFSSLLLEGIQREKGSEGLGNWLRGVADQLSVGLAPRMAGKDPAARLTETANVMNELNYEATARPEAGVIEATNCVYHDLAVRFPEVCQFDLAILEHLTGGTIDHQECLAKGGGACRFKVTPKREASSP